MFTTPSSKPNRAASLQAGHGSGWLKNLVRSTQLDGQAVAAVLVGAGVKLGRKGANLTQGLSEREIKVLRLLARDFTTRQVAKTLVISPNELTTVG